MVSALLGGLIRHDPPQLVLVGSQRYEHIKGTFGITPDHIICMNLGTSRNDIEAVLQLDVEGVVFHRYAPDPEWAEGWAWQAMGKSLPDPQGTLRIRGPRKVSLTDA
jgi:hypothetical protein